MLYDISPPISARLRVFPGDTPPSREVLLDMERGDPLTLSTFRSTVHVGAHIDAPSHYGRDAESIEAVPLERCLGPCQVMRVAARRGERVGVADLRGKIESERLLLATGTHPDPNEWPGDYAAIEPALVRHLAAKGVVLVGIDTPSVDPSTSKDLPAHQAFLAAGMTILEGLVLDGVPDGHYELIALPLRLEGFDASPVRAVLRGLGERAGRDEG
jgi:arylformamidase